MLTKLNIENHKRICRKFASSYPTLIPSIISLSSYYDITKQITTVHISGNNFRQFSTVFFAETSIPFTFINSENISFDVPRNYLSGSYSVQVYNDSYSSNIVFYELNI